jgi:hypothetical protein
MSKLNRELIKPGPVSFRPTFKLLERGEIVKQKSVGLGSTPDMGAINKVIGLGATPDMDRVKRAETIRAGLGSFTDAIQASITCPIFNMPVMEQVRWGMQGPQTDISTKKNFGAKIDLFGGGTSPEGIDFVETTMAQTGQTQTHMIACGIFLHLEPEPLCWTARGNAWTTPTTGLVQPPSPDVFTQNDRANGALGAAIAAGTQVMVPAVLEWGWWANYVAWHLVRGYDLRWKIGQHTNIMDEVARHTAYMPGGAQEASASDSEVDIVEFVERTNQRYSSLGSGLIFLKVNRIRVGSVAVAGANVGAFRPSRDEEFVGATYGGIDLRSLLKPNSEVRTLALPYIIKAGVPIGLVLQENDTDQADTMRDYLSITQGNLGSVPPLVTDEDNILAAPDATGVAPVAEERTLDGANVPQQVDAERAIFKGGDLKITLGVKGFEVNEDWYNVLQSNPDIRNVVASECGVKFASSSS